MPSFNFELFDINFPINSNNNNFFQNAYKIRLIKNTKDATSDWKDQDTKKWKQNYSVGVCNNLGAPCGPYNDLIVVDLDTYHLEKGVSCDFLERFYNNDVMNHRGIVQKSPRGGYHCFFRYREGFKNYRHLGKNGHIDIRTQGGYIVLSPSKIDGQIYEILKNEPLEHMSDEMFNFIQELYQIQQAKAKEEKEEKEAKKSKKKKKLIIENKQEDLSTEIDTAYHITEEEFIKVVEKLPEETFTNYDKWLSFTTMCKLLNFEKVWDDTNKTKPNYNERNNQKHWKAVDTKYEGRIDDVLGSKQAKLFRDMFKYKKEPQNEIQPQETFHRNKVGYDYLQDGTNYILKSDTGTGKTTAFKSYMDRSNGRPFLSIVSRMSLADSQYDTFTKDCGNRIVHHYKHTVTIMEEDKEVEKGFQYEDYNELDSVIITIDSLSKFTSVSEFKNHIVFLDEVNSMIEYLITCSTLKNTRVAAYQFLIGVLKTCHQIIAVDADISDLTHMFLKQTGRTFQFVENTFIHNQGIPSKELHNENEMITRLQQEEKYILCMDSATEAERIYRALNDPTIKLITRLSVEADEEKREKCETCKGEKDERSDSVECEECCKFIPYHELDKHDKVIFSPKIVYGIDSLMKRPVYAYYKEHTISPRGMIQQICRNRNITEVNYLFTKQSFKYNAMTKDKINTEIKLLDRYGCKHFNIMEEYLSLFQNNQEKAKKADLEYKRDNINYISLVSHIIHTNNCLNTNKRVHFRLLLEKRGFIDTSKNIKTKKNTLTKEEKQALKEEKIEHLDAESNSVEKINEYLQIPKGLIKAYSDLFIDQNKLTDHLNWRTYAHNYEANDMCDYSADEEKPEIITTPQSIKNRITRKQDFNLQRVQTSDYKLLFLLKFRDALGLRNVYTTDFYNIEPVHPVDDTIVVKLQNEYKSVFKTRAKELDFKKMSCVNKHMMLMHKSLFGENIINSEEIRRQVGTKSIKTYKYTINMNTAKYHQVVIDYSRSE